VVILFPAHDDELHELGRAVGWYFCSFSKYLKEHIKVNINIKMKIK
jgi:hypothetical protein